MLTAIKARCRAIRHSTRMRRIVKDILRSIGYEADRGRLHDNYRIPETMTVLQRNDLIIRLSELGFMTGLNDDIKGYLKIIWS